MEIKADMGVGMISVYPLNNGIHDDSTVYIKES